MKILSLADSEKPHGVEIRALLGETEFQQLLGHLDHLGVFATETIVEPATAIKTGARHSYAKYLLFPVKLRRQFKNGDYDFDKPSCGVMTYRDKLFVIYSVQRKGIAEESSEDRARPDDAEEER